MPPVVALVDCNSFYASCERVFRPDLVGKPIIVLSNNDGCVVARSAEAKTLGIPMGVPAFEIEQEIRRHKIAVFSSNYALYGDMSRRVNQTLEQFSDDIEVYSVDESFLRVPEQEHCDLVGYGQRIRETVERWTGLPVCCGIGPTKALAKLANRLAKKSQKAAGVVDLTNPRWQLVALRQTHVGDIWGIGGASTRKLERLGIHNALQLRDAPDSLIMKTLTVVGLKLVHELRGIPSIDWELVTPRKQEICVSRMFGEPITTLAGLQEAIASYAARAAEKLRRQQSYASLATVFCHTNQFSEHDPQYHPVLTCRLPVPSNATNEIQRHLLRMTEVLHRPGARWKKAGVIFSELVSERQLSLFYATDRCRDDRLCEVLDQVNDKHGAKTLRFGAEGIRQNWQAKFEKRSPRYTTRWDEVPVVLT